MSGFEKQFILQSSTNAALNVYHAPASEKAIGIIHINHGLAEHAARYGDFARSLKSAGFHVYAHDHRGHGQTKAKDAPFGVFSCEGDGIQKLLSDCAFVQRHAKATYPTLPLIMFGHSMGGLITMNFVLENSEQLAGAAIWNSNFDAGFQGRLAQAILWYERFRLGADMPSRLLPKLTFQAWAKQIKSRRTEFDWLSNIEAEVKQYITDPLCGKDASVSLWLDVFKLIFNGNKIEESKADKMMPVMLVGGCNDPATDEGKAVRAQAMRLKKAGFEDVFLTLYENTRHETLNDTISKKAVADFVSFAKYCCQSA